jgi:hypothetical protein
LIDAAQVWTTGRTVQCEACGQQWRAVGQGEAPSRPVAPPAGTVADTPVPPPEPDDPPEPEPEAPPAPAPEEAAAPEAGPAMEPMPAPALFRAPPARRGPRPRPARGLNWAMAVVVSLTLILVGGVAFRDAIVRAAPAMAGLYQGLGLSVARPGPKGPRCC